jgi:hypothetical protein
MTTDAGTLSLADIDQLVRLACALPTVPDVYMLMHPRQYGRMIRMRNVEWDRDAYLRRRARRAVRGR